ncbi:MAG: RraA family protein [Acidobacteria bacterium]|nr:RraA family protein [Acidobacteriota bacterium]
MMKGTRKWILSGASLVALFVLVGFQQAKKAAPAGDPLIDGFKKTTVASVSDAVDQVVGARGYMSHEMRPRIPGQVVGRARTALVRPAPPERATPALSTRHSVEMIEEAGPGEVGVIVMENGLDVAAIGGLMATAAKSRAMAGIIADGGIRDLAEIRALGLPVYSRSVIASTAVGRWASVSKNTEVQCAGVKVRPGDIVVAGEDGVVVVPREKAADVLKRAQEIDERETKMVPFIKQYKSLSKAIAVFNRI